MTLLPQPGAPLLTDRLALHALASTDLEAIFELHADRRTFEHDSTAPVRDRERMREVLETWISAREELGLGYATVHPRADGPRGALLGVCGLTRYDLAGREVLSAYYRFSPAAWGRGIAAEAMRAVLAQADRALPGVESVVITDRGNTPSLALAGRLGYRATDAQVPDGPHLVVLSRVLGDPGAR